MDRPHTVRLAVFDFDGTLVDSQSAIAAAMAAAWRGHGRDAPAAADVRRVVGLPLVDAVARLLPEADGDEHESLAQSYKQYFLAARANGEHAEPLYPGAMAALDALDAAGVLLGIATGKGQAGLIGALEQHGIEARFVTLQTSDLAPGKPSPEMLRRAMDEAGAERGDTVMIGDTTFDIEMARNAGVAAIGVGWGYHDAEELRAAGAAVVIEAFADVPAAVQDLLRRA